MLSQFAHYEIGVFLDDITLGEIARTVKRIEERLESLSKEVREAVLANASLGTRMLATEQDVTKLESDVKNISAKSAAISGGIGALAFIANWLRGH